MAILGLDIVDIHNKYHEMTRLTSTLRRARGITYSLRVKTKSSTFEVEVDDVTFDDEDDTAIILALINMKDYYRFYPLCIFKELIPRADFIVTQHIFRPIGGGIEWQRARFEVKDMLVAQMTSNFAKYFRITHEDDSVTSMDGRIKAIAGVKIPPFSNLVQLNLVCGERELRT